MDLDQERPGIQEGQTESTDGAQRDPVKPGVIPQQQLNPRSRERQRGQLSEDDKRSRQRSLFSVNGCGWLAAYARAARR
jgi:hypothetical protein